MILVISYPEEEHTARVVEHIHRAGREVVQLDLADFPAKCALQARWSNDGVPTFIVEHQGKAIDLNNAQAVWWRRVQPFVVDPSVSQEQHRAFAHSETSQAVHGMLDSLCCGWTNPREADAAAHHKPLQWTVARQLGIPLPRTLVTTNAQAAREFVQHVSPAKVVFKAFLASIQEWRETRIVEQEDLNRLNEAVSRLAVL